MSHLIRLTIIIMVSIIKHQNHNNNMMMDRLSTGRAAGRQSLHASLSWQAVITRQSVLKAKYDFA
jgi:hypothetical protein